ncbi:hypothetical protein [Pinisolibacter aquiterrae]|uniref:hypothetical protein n=1 Tax=Pinisolibacter aquiterrae TaxID=2815579 RepID=UPI001C3DE48E|nr:hypothetical protein [Pinisolibacter aquiterrae]MBV5262858.1 hypothetical protein [Pinisolibacter aquiterrae]MCC8236428.1 hypothetical protein [Pinisolibacter aquiterrae]
MARQPARFKTSDITRAFKGALAAGVECPRVEVEPNGRIVVLVDRPAPSAPQEPEVVNPWDEAV